ncbi:MAG: hypothetical protein V1653_01135 [bacterium]
MSNEKYEKTELLLDIAEDIVLGYLAKERYANSTERNYADITTVLKKWGL